MKVAWLWDLFPAEWKLGCVSFLFQNLYLDIKFDETRKVYEIIEPINVIILRFSKFESRIIFKRQLKVEDNVKPMVNPTSSDYIITLDLNFPPFAGCHCLLKVSPTSLHLVNSLINETVSFFFNVKFILRLNQQYKIRLNLMYLLEFPFYLFCLPA